MLGKLLLTSTVFLGKTVVGQSAWKFPWWAMEKTVKNMIKKDSKWSDEYGITERIEEDTKNRIPLLYCVDDTCLPFYVQTWIAKWFPLCVRTIDEDREWRKCVSQFILSTDNYPLSLIAENSLSLSDKTLRK